MTKLSLFLLCIFSVFAITVSPLVAAQPAPMLPPCAAEGYRLAWQNEFDGDALNKEAWNIRAGERFASMNTAENVEVKDGRLLIHVRKEKAGKLDYTSGGVISKREFKYGCYEARFKCPPGAGWYTSFWLMKNSGKQTGNRQEIDICEADSKDQKSYGANLHIHFPERIGLAGRRITTPDLSADFHTWTTEFTPLEIRHYFDGRLVGVHHAGTFQHDPMSIWLTTVGWANLPWAPQLKIDDTRLPAVAEFDYVRFFEKPGIEKEKPAAIRTVIVFGDSLTEGKSGGGQAWVKRVERESKGRLTLINEGKGGRATGDGKNEFDRMTAKHPRCDVMVIALGTNDSRDLKQGSVDKAAANVSHMIERARHCYGPGLDILIVAPPNLNKNALVATKPIANEREAQLKALGTAFQKLAAEKKCRFVSLFGGVPESTMVKDGVHPDAEGHTAMAARMLPALLP